MGPEMIIGLLPKLSLIGGIVVLVFGILILVFPKILNYVVGIFLILCGIAALIAYFRIISSC